MTGAIRKKLSIDAKKLQQDGVKLPEDAFALVRLHTGNFANFLELAENGKDFRVLADDETTPLKFYIEKFDALNEMALIWVKLPKELATAAEPSFWLYYGNAEAVDAQDSKGAYDVSEVLSYQFESASFKDMTANATNPTESTATYGEGGLIAGAAVFQGKQRVKIPNAPSLVMAAASGWTMSTWLKFDQAQQAVILQRASNANGVTLSLKDQTPVLDITDASGAKQVLTAQATVAPGTWHNLTVTAGNGTVTLYIDGAAAGQVALTLADISGEMSLGADLTGANGFTGMIDQFSVYKTVKDANAIKFDVQMQGVGSALLSYGDDLTPDSDGEEGESYFMATLDNVTIDGWVIIGILGVMFVISWMVMLVKIIVINRVHGQNKKFEEAFSKIGVQDLTSLNHEDGEDDEQFEESPLLFSLTEHQNSYAGSSIYRIYHTGVDEMNKRLR
ncbi:DUF2341 domain-containing protein, partial [Methylocucumis oryzae]|uniref:DUF2341 domain-containing protein n=1 Tax=Methylocucumis oryzae TaxID=1632867 RepID=UPI000696D3DE